MELEIVPQTSGARLVLRTINAASGALSERLAVSSTGYLECISPAVLQDSLYAWYGYDATTGNVTAWDPPRTVVRWAGGADLVVRGIEARADRIMMVYNDSVANIMYFTHQDPAAAAANRILTGGTTVGLAGSEGALLVYLSAAQRWRIWKL
jgi:hypothetical protein